MHRPAATGPFKGHCRQQAKPSEVTQNPANKGHLKTDQYELIGPAAGRSGEREVSQPEPVRADSARVKLTAGGRRAYKGKDMGRSCARWMLLLCATIHAQTAQDRTIRIPKVNRAPQIEDFLDGKAPEAGLKVTDFRQNNPGDGDPVSEETAAYLSYDRENLYIVFVCKAAPGTVRARYTRRDELYPDDVVGVNFDTWHDRQRSFFFYSNAHGIQLDGLYTEGQGDETSFDTLWASEGQITEDGFVVWMAFPFRSLRFPGEKTQSWGIALSRQMPRRNE
jgi:hypothetical protein